jgi:hypothetical protein
MKTIAIVNVFLKRYGDMFNTVLGLDISLEEAASLYASQFEREDRQDQEGTKLAFVSIAQIPDEAIDPEDGESFTYYDKTIVLPEFWLNDADSMDVVRDGHLVMTYITKSETSDDVLVKSASFDSMRKAQAKLDEWLDADKDAANADWVDYIIAVPVAYASQAASASVIPEDFITGAYGKDYTGKYKEDCDLYWPDEFMAEED